MQVSYSYDGEPEITLIIDIPKMRDQKLESKAAAQHRVNLYAIMSQVDEESKANPDDYSAALFRTIKEKYNTIVLLAVVFSMKDGAGRSVLTYTSRDVVR